MTTINEADPCGAAETLRGVYRAIISGGRPASVSFSSGPNGTERDVTYHRPDAAALLREIRRFEAECAKAQGGKPRRFAVRAGGRR